MKKMTFRISKENPESEKIRKVLNSLLFYSIKCSCPETFIDIYYTSVPIVGDDIVWGSTMMIAVLKINNNFYSLLDPDLKEFLKANENNRNT